MNTVYRVFLRDVTTVLLVFLNNGTAAMLVYPTNPPGFEVQVVLPLTKGHGNSVLDPWNHEKRLCASQKR